MTKVQETLRKYNKEVKLSNEIQSKIWGETLKKMPGKKILNFSLFQASFALFSVTVVVAVCTYFITTYLVQKSNLTVWNSPIIQTPINQTKILYSSTVDILKRGAVLGATDAKAPATSYWWVLIPTIVVIGIVVYILIMKNDSQRK